MSLLKSYTTNSSNRCINCCDTTRNVDDMFDFFDSQRSDVINLLTKDPERLTEILWTENSPISIDRECLCQMGQYEVFNDKEKILDGSRPNLNPIIRKMYSCPQCTNMGRLFNLNSTNLNKPIIIEYGKKINSEFFLEIIDISLLKIELTDKPNDNLKNIFSKNNNISVCEPSLSKLTHYKFLGLDKFTNQILMTWYLDHITSKININTINKMYTAFICGDKGYFFYKLPSIGSLINLVSNKKYLEYINSNQPILKRELTYKILLQLFSSLDFLKKYDFTHGNINKNSIMFDETYISYVYDGIKVSSDIGIKLFNFSSGGININTNIRIYNKSEIAENQIDSTPFEPLVKTLIHIPYIESMDNYNSKKQSYAIYQLTKSSSHTKYQILFLYLQHMGFPLYQSSFGAYSYMILLMTNPVFYYSIISDQKLNSIWQSMWNPDEFSVINEKMKACHNKINSINSLKIIKILSLFHLRCNCIEMVWNKLKYMSVK